MLAYSGMGLLSAARCASASAAASVGEGRMRRLRRSAVKRPNRLTTIFAGRLGHRQSAMKLASLGDRERRERRAELGLLAREACECGLPWWKWRVSMISRIRRASYAYVAACSGGAAGTSSSRRSISIRCTAGGSDPRAVRAAGLVRGSAVMKIGFMPSLSAGRRDGCVPDSGHLADEPTERRRRGRSSYFGLISTSVAPQWPRHRR